MTVYVVVGGRAAEQLGAAIQNRFAGEFYHAFGSTWFVNAALTTREVSAALRLPDGESGAQAIVMPVSNYAGWAPKGVWEWLRSREVVATGG